ncbi:hypothetical protein WG936_08105 [Corynebacterium sp. H127]|uniref:hypothetical protein n=1 Tax=Corynebacterium sp. H127 TaxID=3133418 RepID=UPI0030950F92
MTYVPIVQIEGQEPDDVSGLEILLKDSDCTHIEGMDGRVWRIFPWLNKKSVPINDATSNNPQRLVWAKVKSFGAFEEPPC